MGVDGDHSERKPCYGLSDLFFSEDPAEQESAKSICRRECTRGVWCAEQALKAIAAGETGGVWAGVTLQELKEELRDVDRKRARTAGHASALDAGPDADALPEVRDEPDLEHRDLRGVQGRTHPAAGA